MKKFMKLLKAFITVMAILVVSQPVIPFTSGQLVAADGSLQIAFTQESTSLSVGEEGTWNVTITNPDPNEASSKTLSVTIPMGYRCRGRYL